MLLLILGCTSQAATIVNGSFESGVNPGTTKPSGSTDITGWIVLPTNIDWVAGLGNTPDTLASDGALFIDLNGLVAGGIQQTFATIIGQQYTITFDMNANGTPGLRTRSLQISAGADSGVFTATSELTWTTYNFQFLATSVLTDLAFVSLFTTGSACGPAVDAICAGPMIDNVRIADGEAVPEPSTLSLAAVGLAVAAAYQRRRAERR